MVPLVLSTLGKMWTVSVISAGALTTLPLILPLGACNSLKYDTMPIP